MKHFALIGLMLLIAACQGQPLDSHLAGDIAGYGAERGVLGSGVDAVSARLTGASCFEGPDSALKESVQPHPNSDSSVKVSHNLDFDQLRKLFAGELQVEIPIYPGINGIGIAGFANEFRESKLRWTSTIHLNYRSLFEMLSVQDAHGVELSASAKALQAYYGNQASDEYGKQLNQMCGEEYVSEVHYGYSFLASLKIEFKTEYEMKHFKAGIGADILQGLATAEGVAGFTNKILNSGGRVSIFIKQDGGNFRDLLPVLRSIEGTETSTAVNGLTLYCTTSNIEKCAKVFQRLYKYAANVSETLATQDPSFFVPLYYKTSPYLKEGNMGQLSLDGVSYDDNRVSYDDVIDYGRILQQQNRRIAHAKSFILADLRRADFLKDTLGKILEERNELSDRVNDLNSAVGKARTALKAAEAACAIEDKDVYNPIDVQACQTKVDAAKAATNYDRTLLTVEPPTFQSWCILAHAPDVLDEMHRDTVKLVLERENSLGEFISDGTNDAATAGKIVDNCSTDEGDITELELDWQEGSPTMTSFLPLKPFINLEVISARDHGLRSAIGLETFERLVELDLAGNLFRSLEGFSKVQPASSPNSLLNLEENRIISVSSSVDSDSGANLAGWANIDLSANALTEIGGLKVSQGAHLNLSENDLEDSSGLLELPNEVTVDISDTLIDCPYDSEDSRTCLD